LIPTTPFAVNEEIFHQNLSFNPNYGRNDHSLIETSVPLNNIPATKVRKCFSKILIYYYYFNVFISKIQSCNNCKHCLYKIGKNNIC
jgi:hypothetical protein